MLHDPSREISCTRSPPSKLDPISSQAGQAEVWRLTFSMTSAETDEFWIFGYGYVTRLYRRSLEDRTHPLQESDLEASTTFR